MKLDKYTIAKRYSKAIYELAVETDQLEVVNDQLTKLREVFEEIPDLGFILTDERLEPNEKLTVIAALEKGFCGMVCHFIHVVYENRRMDDMPRMIAEFYHLYDEHQGIIKGSVTTVTPLTSSQKEKLETKIANLLGYSTAQLKMNIDPTIIGGVIVEANNHIIDGSIKTKLNHFYSELVK